MAAQLAARKEEVGRHSGPAPAAAASAVLPVVMGEPLTGTVLGVFRQAVILAVNPPAPPRVVSLLSPRASGVPNGVRIAGGPDFAGCASGDPVQIGAGDIEVSDLRVRVVRSWNSTIPRVRLDPALLAAFASATAEADLGVPRDAIQPVESALADEHGNLGAAVHALVGLGSGLTPGGDDVLAGLLTALHARGMATLAGRIGVHAVRHAADRTTTLLSAELLRLAAAGHACQELLAVVRALHGSAAATPDGGARLARAAERLLSVGHTSGADLAAGLLLGLQYQPPPAPQPVAGQEAG